MNDYSNTLQELQEAETELSALLKAGKKPWMKIYQRLEEIELKKLWIVQTFSFSAWLRLFAKKNNISEALLWHNRAAGKFFDSFLMRNQSNNIDIEKIANAKIASESINYIEKISQKDTQKADQLIFKVINKEMTTQELKAIWQATKKAETKNQQPVQDIMQQLTDTEWLDCEKKYGRGKKYLYIPNFPLESPAGETCSVSLAVAENYTTISASDNLTGAYAPTPPPTPRNHERTNLTVPCQNKGTFLTAPYQKPVVWKFNTHSIFFLTAASQVPDRTSVMLAIQYTDFCWTAIPYSLKDTFKSSIPDTFGLLVLMPDNKKLRTFRKARKNPVSETHKLQTICTFLMKL